MSVPPARPNAKPQRLDRLAFIAVGAFVLTVTWNGIRVGGGALGNVFLVLAVLAVLAHVVVDRRPIRIPPWLLVTAAGMVIAALLVVIFPPSLEIQSRTLLQFNQLALTAGTTLNAAFHDRSNVSALVKWETGLLAIPVLISLVATTPSRINRLLDLWTISAAINAFVGVLDYAGFHALAATAIEGHRSGGLTVQANYLALTCAFGIPTALRWVGRSERGTVAGLATTALLIGGEFATGSRDGIVTAAIAVFLAVVFLPRLQPGLRFVVPSLGIVAVFVLFFTHAGHGILDQLRLGGTTTSTNGSDYQRAVAAHVADAQIASRPIAGVGFSVDNDAQNIYLQILAAGGVILMSAFLVFLGGLASCIRRAARGPVREEAIAIGICLIIWLINGYFDSQIADKYLYVLPGILISCAYVTSTVISAVPAAAFGAFGDQPLAAPAAVGAP